MNLPPRGKSRQRSWLRKVGCVRFLTGVWGRVALKQAADVLYNRQNYAVISPCLRTLIHYRINSRKQGMGWEPILKNPILPA